MTEKRAVQRLRIGILASHDGSNAQALIDACASDTLDGRVVVIISNNSTAPVMDRARQHAIPTAHISTVTHPDPELRDTAILDELHRQEADVIILAGYMKKLGPRTLAGDPGRVLNIHPALLPRHGGPGMFGRHVHDAVLAANDRETGVTVHLVDKEYDRGRTITQRAIPVLPDDTSDSLAARLKPVEHELIIESLIRIASEQSRPREHAAVGSTLNRDGEASMISAPLSGGQSTAQIAS